MIKMISLTSMFGVSRTVSIRCPTIALSAIGISDLCVVCVIGRIRVPFPAIGSTSFIWFRYEIVFIMVSMYFYTRLFACVLCGFGLVFLYVLCGC